jgi:hypothetical protein
MLGPWYIRREVQEQAWRMKHKTFLQPYFILRIFLLTVLNYEDRTGVAELHACAFACTKALFFTLLHSKQA